MTPSKTNADMPPPADSDKNSPPSTILPDEKTMTALVKMLDEQRDLLLAAEQKLASVRASLLPEDAGDGAAEKPDNPAKPPAPSEPVADDATAAPTTDSTIDSTPEQTTTETAAKPGSDPPPSTRNDSAPDSLPTPAPEPKSDAKKNQKKNSKKNLKKDAKSTPKARVDAEPDSSSGASWITEYAPKLKIIGVLILIALLIAGGYYVWERQYNAGPGEGFASGNGRIEATEIDVAAKLAGRVDAMLVNEGDFVEKGQVLAKMQIEVLDAQRDEARAQQRQAISSVVAADAQVQVGASDKAATLAQVAVRESELDAAERRLARSVTLSAEGASSEQELDDDRARVQGARANLRATQAQVRSAEALINAAKAQVAGAQATVTAADATITRIEADITDSALIAPRAGRVQYRIVQTGEVVASGGKVLNLVDLADVYFTCFVPEVVAGRLALGSEAHIILDAASQYVIPAKISFVSSTAQFTPKTVETASERQKLMFRVKVKIDPELLKKHISVVKTGLPGVAWFKLDQRTQWPAELASKVPE